jgi:uncharacterized protein YidB (DUF937 family)
MEPQGEGGLMATYTTVTIRKAQERQRAYKAGYSEALADILTALEDGGEDAVREWISQNYDEGAYRP